MNQVEKANTILAVLMSSNEPVHIKNLANAFEPQISYEEVKILLREIKFNEDVMFLSEKSEFYQLIIKSKYQKNINLHSGKNLQDIRAPLWRPSQLLPISSPSLDLKLTILEVLPQIH